MHRNIYPVKIQQFELTMSSTYSSAMYDAILRRMTHLTTTLINTELLYWWHETKPSINHFSTQKLSENRREGCWLDCAVRADNIEWFSRDIDMGTK